MFKNRSINVKVTKDAPKSDTNTLPKYTVEDALRVAAGFAMCCVVGLVVTKVTDAACDIAVHNLTK